MYVLLYFFWFSLGTPTSSNHPYRTYVEVNCPGCFVKIHKKYIKNSWSEVQFSLVHTYLIDQRKVFATKPLNIDGGAPEWAQMERRGCFKFKYQQSLRKTSPVFNEEVISE